MDNKIVIRKSEQEDNEQLLELVNKSPIKGTFTFINEKKRFQDRSELFDNFIILVAENNMRIIGVLCGAAKDVITKDGIRKAGYVFDLRIDPEVRERKIASRLMVEIAKELVYTFEVDFFYSLIDDKNLATTTFFNKFDSEANVITSIHLCMFPIYKRKKVSTTLKLNQAENQIDIQQKFIQENKEKMMYCSPDNIFGNNCYKGTYFLDENHFFSIWDQESIRRERVIHIPIYFRILGFLFKILSPIKKLPRIPKKNDYYKTWYIFNLPQEKKLTKLKLLLDKMNNLAFEEGVDMLLIPVPDSPLQKQIKKHAFTTMKMNLAYFIVNDVEFDPTKEFYFDIRDD